MSAAALHARAASAALYLSSIAWAITEKPLASLWLVQYFGVPVLKESCGTPAPVSGPCRAMRIVFLPKSMPVVVPLPG